MRKLIFAILIGSIAIAADAQTIQLAEGHDLSSPDRQPFALSPDGTRVWYMARATVFMKPVAGGEAVVVQGPLQGRNKSNLIVSSDGRSLSIAPLWIAGSSICFFAIGVIAAPSNR